MNKYALRFIVLYDSGVKETYDTDFFENELEDTNQQRQDFEQLVKDCYQKGLNGQINIENVGVINISKTSFVKVEVVDYY